MAPVDVNSRFTQIKMNLEKIEGFLDDTNVAVWDSFLGFQESHHVTGNLLEIGVYKGKSAIILANHQQTGEQLWLVDFSDFLDEAKTNIGSLIRRDVKFIKQKSVELHRNPLVPSHRRTFRWIHIDGEHTGQAVGNDLALAHELLTDEGIVCVDDFFHPAYPQVTAATYAFLNAQPFGLTLFACGYNKGYLARPTFARRYMQMIRSSLAAELRERGIVGFTLFKTSPTDDYNCWGICPRFRDQDYYGLDADPDEFC